MKTLYAVILSLAAFAAPVAAQDEDPCALPGVLVVEDAGNDSGVQPGVGDQDFLDLQTLHMAEPADLPGKLVFTMKMRGLSQTPPGVRWAVQFTGPATPAATDEGWFVMMSTLLADDAGNVAGAPRFLYGTTGVTSVAVTGVRTYTVLGELAEGSGFDADGTITLIADKAAMGNPQPGVFLDPVFPVIRTIVTPNGNTFDQGPNGFYEVTGGSCEEEKSVLGVTVGALPPGLLAMFALAALAGLRRRR